jgi:hypothetical protein
MGSNNNSSENTNFGQEEEVLEAKKCDFCSKTTNLTRETEIYYNAGRNRKIVNLCYDIYRYNDASPISDNCYNHYFSEIGYNLIVVGWYEAAYATVLSMFISSPLMVILSSSSGNGDMTIARKIITNNNTAADTKDAAAKRQENSKRKKKNRRRILSIDMLLFSLLHLPK